MSLVAVASNPFERYKGIGKPEEKKERKVEPTGLEGLLKKYEKALEDTGEFSTGSMRILLSDWLVTERLTPEQIGQFLQLTVNHEHEWYSHYTGFFINYLIKNSCKAGHNRFRLNTKTLPDKLYYIGWNLKGIEITIEGDIGEACGHGADNIIMQIHGNAGGELGTYSTRSKFHVYGDVEYDCGKSAEDSAFYLHGNFKLPIGQTDFGELPAKRTMFAVYSTKKYKKLIRNLPPEYANQAICLNPRTNKMRKRKML